MGSIPTLVRVFLCPCVGPFPSVGLTLTWFIWDINLALHLTLYSVISELVGNHSVIEVPFVPHVVNPLSVFIQSSGKKRLILDFRHVNQSIWKQKFKCEDWRVFLSYVNKGDFLFSFDLKYGYHHFDIFPDHQIFLGFSWVFSGTVKYFCFTVLPFGLSSAPYIFTKCLRPLVKFWRFNGIKIVVSR